MELKQGYKKSEIGVIPKDWAVKQLGDIGDVRMCRRIFNHETTLEGEVPFYKIGTFGSDPDAYISRRQYEDYSQRFSFPRKGEVLISAAGTIGRTIVYNGEDAYYQDSNIVWIDNNFELVSNEYLYHVLQVAKYQTEGGTIQRLYNSILKSTKFACPTKAEQTAIATALSDMDKLIAGLEKLIEKKKAIKQGAMQELLRPKEGWVVKTFGELFEITSSKRVFQSEWKTSGVPFYRAREIAVLGDNGFVENELFISTEMYEKYKAQYGVPQKDDLLVTGVGTLGKVYLVEGNHDFYFKDGNIIWFKINNSINTEFIKQLFSTKVISRQIEDASAGTTVGTYTITGAKNTLIPFPPRKEQNEIANILSDLDTQVSSLEQNLAKYKLLKIGMMQELLTGKTRLV